MQKFLTLTIALFLSCLACQAQVLPVYFRRGAQIMDKDLADSYGVTGKLPTENVYVLKLYTLDDELMQTGTYKDEALTIPHGVFIFYSDIEFFNNRYLQFFPIKDTSRFLTESGNFENGVEEGKWLIFYPDGNLMNEQTFKGGVLNGTFTTYNRKGKIMINGNYVDGKKNGDWLFNGRKTETYIMDVLVRKGSATKLN